MEIGKTFTLIFGQSFTSQEITVENKNIVWNGLFCREPKDFPFLPDKNEMKVTGPPQVDQE